MLSNHKWDDDYKEHVKKQKQKNNNNSIRNNNDETNKKDEEQEGTNMNQDKEVTCFCCGEKGHYSDSCPKKMK